MSATYGCDKCGKVLARVEGWQDPGVPENEPIGSSPEGRRNFHKPTAMVELPRRPKDDGPRKRLLCHDCKEALDALLKDL